MHIIHQTLMNSHFRVRVPLFDGRCLNSEPSFLAVSGQGANIGFMNLIVKILEMFFRRNLIKSIYTPLNGRFIYSLRRLVLEILVMSII